VWRMNLDPQTLKAVAMERVTIGQGSDTDPSLSRDGRTLAFTAESRHVQAWLFPFDATRGRITGAGHAVTSAGTNAWRNDLSRDGKILAFTGVVGGKPQVWEKSLPSGLEAPIVAADSYVRGNPRVSFDGTRL